MFWKAADWDVLTIKEHPGASGALQKVPLLSHTQICARSWHILVPAHSRPCPGSRCNASSFRDRIKYKDKDNQKTSELS